jgi:hypothetical protein
MSATYGMTEAKDNDSDDVSRMVGDLQRLADSHETVQLAAQAIRRLRICSSLAVHCLGAQLSTIARYPPGA